MNDQTMPTADMIVSRYLELRDYRKEREDTFKQEMAPYVEAMAALESAAAELMRTTGQKALSTEHGTAYQSHVLSTRCEDPKEFFEFVFNIAMSNRALAQTYLTTHVGKEAVETYMQGVGGGHPPPGVKTEMVIKTNFRKA